jgi:superfamily II DNA or RNA helicase
LLIAKFTAIGNSSLKGPQMNEIKLQRVGNTLFIRPWYPWYHKLLMCRRKTGMEYSFKKKRQIPKYEDNILYSKQTDHHTGETVTVTYGGLFATFKDDAKKRGYSLHIEDYQEPLPEPDWDLLQELPPLRDGQAETIAAIVSANRGLVVEPTGNGKTFVITALCKIWTSVKILVVCPGIDVYEEMVERIKDKCPGEYVNQQGGGKSKYNARARIGVCTNTSLHKVSTDWPDIILYDEAHTAAAMNVLCKLNQFDTAKMIGFTASPTGRKDGTDMITTALFGPVIRHIPYQEAVRKGNVANIQVRMVHIEGDMNDMYKKQHDKDRFGYWLNRERNIKLINEAKHLFRPDESVLFMVARTEHGLALKQLMPEVAFMHRPINKKQWDKMSAFGVTQGFEYEDMAKVDGKQMKADFMSGKIKWCICTYVWKQGIDTVDLAGLVRFGGEGSNILDIQTSGRLSRKGHDGQKTWGVVIDALDDYGDYYLRQSLTRRKNYQAQGWQIVDC